MGNYQTGYGHGDVVGVPFDFYSGAIAVATGTAYVMQTGELILFPAAAVTGVAVTLPLNPVDGAFGTITNAGAVASTVTLTISANTGDVILAGVGAGVPTVITGAALTTAGSAASTIRYRYTLNGFQPASGVAINPRTWIRVQ
jgi:hypothetical protein